MLGNLSSFFAYGFLSINGFSGGVPGFLFEGLGIVLWPKR